MTNTEIVKSMYEAFGRGDIATILGALTDDVEWVTPGSSVIPTAGRHQGRDGVANFFSKLAESFEFEPFSIERYIEQGDTVVALGSYAARAKPTSKRFQSRWAMVFQLRSGKLWRFEEYLDTAAVEAAFSPAKAARG